MSLPRYSEYKDSGVEWLGEVPAHWGVTKLRYVSTIRKGKLPGQIHPSQINGSDLPYLSMEFLRGETEDPCYVALTHQALCAEPEDILILWDGSNAGEFLRAKKGVVSSTVALIENIKIQRDFLFYLCKASQGHIQGKTIGMGIPHVSGEELRLLSLSFPTTNEQTAIATFLDRETAKIDGLIAEQEKLITLLAEKRQATISHAVTKGLNPDVRMKDSGVAWLGEVPAHWFLGQLKNFIRQKPGAIKTGPFGSHLTSAEMQEGIVKVYNQRSVIDNNFIDGENYISQEKFEQLSSFQAFPGDVLVTTRGTIGRAAILPGNADLGILHPCLLRVQVDEKKLHREFLVALIQGSHLMKTQIALSSNATTIEVIYSETMASLFIPLPPLAEQKAILLFLDSETARLDALTAAATHGIALLKERRSALISAAVTGKIDVREANNQ